MSDSINKIYQGIPSFQSSVVSKMRVNREYLLSNYVADELNTYRTWDPFPVLNDLYQSKYDSNGNELEPTKGPGSPGVRSIFNKSGAVMMGHSGGSPYDVSKESHTWRISNNVPLMDSPEIRRRINEHSKCTIKDLVEASEQGLLGRETYSYSDFMYCKHLGKVPNNYLITLRRFPIPVDDYISSLGEYEYRLDNDIMSGNSACIGCMVTWMGTPGNDMSNILKYNFKMPYKFENAQWEEPNGTGDEMNSPLNSIAAAFDPTYRKHYQTGEVGNAFNGYVGKFFGQGKFSMGDNPYNLADLQRWQDRTKVYGPIDAIKGTFMRAETGLEFDQTMTLQFDYELRSYNGINPRQAMLDLLSNILAVTYSTGTFWGGGYRAGGVGQNNIFTNMKIFKANGGFTSFVDAFAEDYTTITNAAGNTIAANGGIVATVKKLLNSIGGMFLGGILNKLGRPQKIMANSLLSPAPVGFWHVTIGNPHHPIMSLGNMILRNTTIEHYGPLGIDDFPTGLRVTCELERGKPRDSADIEKLYMHGNDRIYSPMGPALKRMYEGSKEYRGKHSNISQKRYTNDGSVDSTNEKRWKNVDKDGRPEMSDNVYNIDEIKMGDINAVWQKYFGMTNEEYIIIAAEEQGYGSQPKKKKDDKGKK